MTNNDDLIQVRNAKFAVDLPSGLFKIIDGINLNIRRGEALGIIGPNGCGKTTLYKLLTKIILPSEGDIDYLEDDLRIGMIFQDVQQNLVPWRKIVDNIALPSILSGKNKKRAFNLARAALSEMILLDLADRYPHELSGGQQQLVSIARWLANPPSVLFIDEGLSMLDLVQRRRAYKKLGKLVDDEKCGICIVSHNISEVAEYTDRALLLTDRPARLAEEILLKDESSFSKRSELLWKATRNIFTT